MARPRDPRQGTLWPVGQPGPARPTSLRVVTTTGTGSAVRDLTIAALRAATAAELHGEAWLVAPDDTFAHVTHDGHVHPLTGWAAAAHLIITRRTPP